MWGALLYSCCLGRPILLHLLRGRQGSQDRECDEPFSAQAAADISAWRHLGASVHPYPSVADQLSSLVHSFPSRFVSFPGILDRIYFNPPLLSLFLRPLKPLILPPRLRKGLPPSSGAPHAPVKSDAVQRKAMRLRRVLRGAAAIPFGKRWEALRTRSPWGTRAGRRRRRSARRAFRAPRPLVASGEPGCPCSKAQCGGFAGRLFRTRRESRWVQEGLNPR